MPQAYFYYQAKIDPTWYLAPAGGAPPPDLSWMQTGIIPGSPRRVFASLQVTVSWFLTPAIAPDLSWLPRPEPFKKRLESYESRQSDISWFLVLPSILPSDLSWIPEAPGPVLRPAVSFLSGYAGTANYMIQPPVFSGTSPFFPVLKGESV